MLSEIAFCAELFGYLLEEQAVRAISRGRKILIIPDPSKNITFTRLKARNYYTVNGYVKDAESGEVLVGANVYNPVTNRGTVTNEFGYYSFTMPQGKQTTNYSFVGFSAVSKTFQLNKRLRSDIFLSTNLEIEEIIVIDQDSSMIWRGREKINLDEIRNLPAVFGEVDILKSISLLPGIQSGNEAQGGLLVRGGSPDQNLIMLDGIPLYEVNHLFGLVSIFNEDAINNVNLYKSDFSAKYGGRLSSVVDIQLKDGNYKDFGGSATVGILGGKMNLEGTQSNINGIGTRVEIETTSNTQIRDVRAGESFSPMSSLNTHFGIGAETEIDRITIYWPSGVVDNLTNQAVNKTIFIEEGSSSAGINEHFLENLVVYPIPTQDELNIKTPTNLENHIISVFDSNGKRVFNQMYNAEPIDVSGLTEGLYFLQIEYKGKKHTQKFLKE